MQTSKVETLRFPPPAKGVDCRSAVLSDSSMKRHSNQYLELLKLIWNYWIHIHTSKTGDPSGGLNYYYMICTMMMVNGHLLKCQTHHSITFTWSKGCPRSVALLLNPLGRDN